MHNPTTTTHHHMIVSDALGNLNGFFHTLASNIQNVEHRKLMPIQENLLSSDSAVMHPREHETKAFIKMVINLNR